MLLFIMAQYFVVTILTYTVALPVGPGRSLAWFLSLAAKTLYVFIQIFQGFTASWTGGPLGRIKMQQVLLQGPETSHCLKYASMSGSRYEGVL